MGIHIATFLASFAVIWFSAGILIESVDRISRRIHKTGFAVAFFALGILTSISEISVATNATINGAPSVSAGNLIGASFVILLFIIPVLSALSGGIELNHAISRRNLAFGLIVIALPVLLILDGDLSLPEGLISIFAYIVFLFAIERQIEQPEVTIHSDPQTGTLVKDGTKILIGGMIIFFAGHLLVEQAVYFADTLSVPRSLIGLILLSIGTNVPELVIAARSFLKGRGDIAFGDYLGSAAANTLIMGFLPFVNGRFGLEPAEFWGTAILLVPGLCLFFMFARSENKISRKESFVLLLFYGAFLITQIVNLFRFSERF